MVGVQYSFEKMQWAVMEVKDRSNAAVKRRQGLALCGSAVAVLWIWL